MPTFTYILPLGLLLLLLVLTPTAHAQKKCARGRFLENDRCAKCPRGTFNDLSITDTCRPCPKGTFNPYLGAQGLDICIECPVNTFGNSTGATSREFCRPCPKGQFAPRGSPQCLRCGPGQGARVNSERLGSFLYHDFFRAIRFICNEGQSGDICTYDAPIEYSCQPCDPNTFSNKPNNKGGCMRCPRLTIAPPGATKCRPQPSCSPGFEFSFGRCQKCSNFRVNDGGPSRCRTCPPGLIGNMRSGASKCVPCPVGTARSMNQDRCRACRAGQNSLVTGAEICYPDNTPCAPNFFRKRNGECTQCDASRRFDEKAKRCVRCPENSLSQGGISTVCTPCPSGMEVSTSKHSCVCKPGHEFVEGKGGGICRKCRPGTFRRPSRSDLRSQVCVECDRRSFAPRAGMTRCESCPRGFRQPLRGQSKCVKTGPCPKGLIPSDEQGCVQPATNCPPNHRRVQVSVTSLPFCGPRTCPSGLAFIGNLAGPRLQNPGSSCRSCRCDVCRKGEFYDARVFVCRDCPSDETSAGGLVRKCTKCPNGKLGVAGRCVCIRQRYLKNGECTLCPAGTFGFDERSGCQPCPPGTFSTGTGSEECEKCRPGTFSNKFGSKSCMQCENGTTTFGLGESGCVRPGSLSS